LKKTLDGQLGSLIFLQFKCYLEKNKAGEFAESGKFTQDDFIIRGKEILSIWGHIWRVPFPMD
jgi:hypothetical protein